MFEWMVKGVLWYLYLCWWTDLGVEKGMVSDGMLEGIVFR